MNIHFFIQGYPSNSWPHQKIDPQEARTAAGQRWRGKCQPPWSVRQPGNVRPPPEEGARPDTCWVLRAGHFQQDR